MLEERLFSYDCDEDEYENPGKMNDRKRLVPLFVYQILKDCSTSRKRLTQSDLIERLDAYPYALSIERKALSRTLHLLADADIGIHSSRNGSWYEPYDYCA